MKNKAILYDHQCPMCALYTQGFVTWKLLEQNNRIPFASLDQQTFIHQVDWQRARHEIPLVDLNGGQTLYGVRALSYILSQRIPWLSRLLSYRLLFTLCTFLYNLVSYNRRIIVPVSASAEGRFTCTPEINLPYRIGFILLAVLSSVLITYAFGQSLNPLLSTHSGGVHMLLIAGTGWVIQLMLGLGCLNNKRLAYAGHLATIMLTGVLLLLPGIGLSWLTGYQYSAIPIGSVLLSSSLMCHQHIIRMRTMGLPQRWTVVWFLVLQSTAWFWIYQFYIN